MPLYEYECETCTHRFEVIQKFSDPPIEVCPDCQGRVRKLLSSPAIQFKGSGWYITDYARKESAKDAGDKKPKTEKTEGSADSAAASSSPPSSSSSSGGSESSATTKD
jgi:putative FmdB family regulatory protein